MGFRGRVGSFIYTIYTWQRCACCTFPEKFMSRATPADLLVASMAAEQLPTELCRLVKPVIIFVFCHFTKLIVVHSDCSRQHCLRKVRNDHRCGLCKSDLQLRDIGGDELLGRDELLRRVLWSFQIR